MKKKILWYFSVHILQMKWNKSCIHWTLPFFYVFFQYFIGLYSPSFGRGMYARFTLSIPLSVYVFVCHLFVCLWVVVGGFSKVVNL